MNADINIAIRDIDFIIKKNYNVNCRYTVADKDTYRIMYVESGRALLRFVHEAMTVEKGDLLVLCPHEEYVLSSCGTENWRFSAISFYSLTPLSFSRKVIKLGDSSRFSEYFEISYKAWQEKNTGYKLFINAIVYNLLYFMVNESDERKATADPFVQKIEDYMHKNYKSKLSLDELASFCGYSVSYFKAHFADRFGVSPMKYLNTLRIERAKELLRTGMYSVGEVAEECGFENLYYFSNVFKKYTGYRPSSFM